MSDMDKIVEELKTGGDKPEDFNTVIRLIESILSLVNNLIEDISKINSLEIDLSKLDIKLEYLAHGVAEIEKKAHCEMNVREIDDLKREVKKLEGILKEAKDRQEVQRQNDLKDKKETFINQGRMVVILSIFMALVLFVMAEKVFPYIKELIK